jgi:hypothetical protein
MCRVLGLGFFNYKIIIYFLIYFYLGPEFETNQVSKPLTPPCPPNLVRKDKEWRFFYMGCGKCGLRCNIINGKRRFTRDDSIHPLCICMIIEEGMGCKKLGSRVQ